MKTCIECGQQNKGKLKRLCDNCYARRRRAGLLETPPWEERVFAKVDKRADGCWLWTGAADANGYGRVGMPGRRTALAHRAIYEHLVGPIPAGLTLDHLCFVPACVNPAHLEAVPAGVNARRGRGALMAAHRHGTCTKGHPIAGDNAAKHGDRFECRTCKNNRRRTIQ